MSNWQSVVNATDLLAHSTAWNAYAELSVLKFTGEQLAPFLASYAAIQAGLLSSWLVYRYHDWVGAARWPLVVLFVAVMHGAPVWFVQHGAGAPSFVYPFMLACVAWVFSMRALHHHIELAATQQRRQEQTTPALHSLVGWILDHVNSPDRVACGWSGRLHSLGRLLGGVARLAANAALLTVLEANADALRRSLPVVVLRCLDFVLLWTLVSGFASVAWGVFGLLGGYRLPKMFRFPVFATSPMQFWNDRWNRFVHGLLRDSTFRPLVRLGLPRPAASLFVFVYSGLAHEYILYCSFGELTGHHLLFFSAQAVLCTVQVLAARQPLVARIVDATPTPVKWLLNTWLMLSLGRWFFAPFEKHVFLLSAQS